MKAFKAAALSAVICLLLPTTQVIAETPTEIRQEISRKESTLDSKKLALETVLSRLSSYQVKLQDARDRLKTVTNDLNEAKQNLTQADADTSSDGPRLRDIAARRLELAEHNVESHRARLDRVERKSDALQSEADNLGSEIERLEQNLTKLAQNLRNTLASERDSAAREQARLKEAITRAEQEAEAARKAEEEAAAQKAAEAQAQLEQQAMSSETALANVASAVSSAEAKVAAPPKAETPLTPLQMYARKEMRLLNAKTRNANKEEERHFLELIMEIDGKEVVELEYLGNHQFYSEVPLKKGKHKITINLRKFVATVPKEADGDTFVVIYDAKDREDGRFVIFNKNLL